MEIFVANSKAFIEDSLQLFQFRAGMIKEKY